MALSLQSVSINNLKKCENLSHSATNALMPLEITSEIVTTIYDTYIIIVKGLCLLLKHNTYHVYNRYLWTFRLLN